MGQLSHRDDIPFPIFDADNHLYEPPEALTKYLPKEYKDVVQYVQINGRTKIAMRGQISNYIPNPTFSVVAKPGAWEEYFKFGNPDGKSKRELFGEPMRAIPAFFEPGPRLEKMNELGLDRTLMFPTLASLIEERLRDDPVAIHVIDPLRSTSGSTRCGASTTRTASSPPRSSPCRSSRRRSRSWSGWSSAVPAPS